MVILKDQSILVTGATGFLGGVIATYLKKQGARVIGTALSRRNQAGEWLVSLNLEDPTTLALLDTRGPYDAVIHCAALLPGKRPDLEVLIANQQMTYNLLEWSVSSNISNFYFASSCNVYGYSDQPCAEPVMPSPPNLYAVSKLACEQIIRIVANSGGIRACNLRISAPYGPGLRTETVVKRFLKQAAQGQPITLMGSGHRSQDFVYEEDVASAFSLALVHQASGTFNISGGQPVSMRELAETALRLFDRDYETSILFSGTDPQELYRGYFPISAAADAFHYYPKVSLEDGLRRSAQAWGLL